VRNNIVKRLSALEDGGTDWISKLEFIDYDGLDDYENGDWDEVFFDDFITVVKHKDSGEVRGHYFDRRSIDEIVAAGGNLAFL